MPYSTPRKPGACPSCGELDNNGQLCGSCYSLASTGGSAAEAIIKALKRSEAGRVILPTLRRF